MTSSVFHAVAPVSALCAAFLTQPSEYPPEATKPDVAPPCGSVAGIRHPKRLCVPQECRGTNSPQICLYRESPAPDQIPGEPSDKSHPEKPRRAAPISRDGHPRSHHSAGNFQCRPGGDPAEKREVCPHQAPANIPLYRAYHLRHLRQTLPPQNHRHGTSLDLLHLQFLRQILLSLQSHPGGKADADRRLGWAYGRNNGDYSPQR